MSELEFSALMCVYGGDNPSYFDQALESVFDQTRQPNEVILVVDGPVTDEIDHVIEKYKVRYDSFYVHRLKENQGHGIARKFGFEKCQYDYVAISDADDINMKNRFEIQMEYFDKEPELGAVSSGCIHFQEDISHIINEELMPQTDAEIKKAMKTRCPMCQASAILNRKAVMEVGGYQDWYMAEDYHLWIRMMLNGARFANVPLSLLYVRTTMKQMERRGGLRYFNSIRKLNKYMYASQIIGIGTYLFNVITRFIVQVLMPRKARAFIRRMIQ